MITFVQNMLQKHYKWLLLLLLGVIIVSFVFTYSSSSGLLSWTGQDKRTRFFGYTLGREADRRLIFEGANLSFYVHTGRTPWHEMHLQQLGLMRATWLHLARVAHIPEPDEGHLVHFIESRPLFADETGSFSAARYQEFQDLLKRNPLVSELFVRQVLADDCKIETVQNALAGPAYLRPEEVTAYAEHLHRVWSVQVATLDAASVAVGTQHSEEALRAFFDLHQERYHSQPELHFSYVCLSEGTAQDQEKLAHKLIGAFYEKGITRHSRAFEDKLAQYGLKLCAHRPLKGGEGSQLPEDSPLPLAALHKASTLTQEHYMTEPVYVPDEGTYILFWDDFKAASALGFEEALPTVMQDFAAFERQERLKTKAQETLQALAALPVQSQEGTQVLSAAGFSHASYTGFTLQHAPQELPGLVAGRLNAGTPVGGWQGPVYTPEKVFLLRVTERREVPVPPHTELWEKAQQELAQISTNVRLQGLMQDWVEGEIGRYTR